MQTTTLTLTLIASLFSLAAATGEPAAADPAPVFTNPTVLTNPYAPFQEGTVYVSRGRESGQRILLVTTHRSERRVFLHQGVPVETVLIEEREFANGGLVEVSENYLAQDDLGNVRFFGEISREFEDGVETGVEADSWLVGGASQPSDPAGIYNSAEPTMYMPAELKVGDIFVQQTIPGMAEILEVNAVGVTVRVPAGKFKLAVRLTETNESEPGENERVWVAPGLGVVKKSFKRSRLRLEATSLVEAAPGT